MERILLVIPSMSGAGGTERMVHSLSALFARGGREVHQATFDEPGASRHFTGTTPVHALGPLPRLPLPLRPISYVMAAWRLRRLKRKLGIEVTISNLWRADLISALSGGPGRKYALCHINIVGNATNRLLLKFIPAVRAIYRRFDRVIAVNEHLAEELRHLYGLPAGQVGHIHNFVDRPARDLCSVFPSDGTQRFIWCGRFVQEKNVDGLLHAWVRFASQRRDVQLVLVGDGPLAPQMRQLAAELGLRTATDPADTNAKLIFAGQVEDPALFMAGARGMLLPSQAEGLPMVVLEALALGLPVLASDCPAGGVRTALLGAGTCDPRRSAPEDSPAGVLLPIPSASEPQTLDAWVKALERLCSDHGQHARWTRGALQRAQLFSAEHAQAQWDSALAMKKATA